MIANYASRTLAAALYAFSLFSIALGNDVEGEVQSYKLPVLSRVEEVVFLEGFQGDDIYTEGWVLSKDSRYDGQKWIHEERSAAFAGDKGLIVSQAHKHHAIVKVLEEPLSLAQDEVTIQYEVRFHDGITCSGAYIKFLAEDNTFKPEELKESSPYVIMFGPDKCGNKNKVHLIFRHQNPVSGAWEEKHMKKEVKAKTDKLSHLYTLQLKNSDQTFRILIDNEEVAKGSLLSQEDFAPPFLPDEEIDDPEDKKPADWVDEAKIPDPEAKKPDDWDEDAPKKILDESATKPEGWLDDEPLEIPDPEAKKPDDWNDEDDGVWEAPLVKNPKCTNGPGCGKWERPLIDNPNYKGKWKAPMIDNPAYKGEWKPKRIRNPNYFEQEKPLEHLPKIGAVAIEILANEQGIQFDNILLSTGFESAKEFAEKTFQLKNSKEATNEKDKKRKEDKEEREKKLEEGGVLALLEYYYGEAREFAETNLPVFLALVLGVTVIPIYFCCFASSKKSTERATEAAHKKDDDAAQPKDADNKKEETAEAEEEEEEEEEAETEGKGAAARRRPRRAD